MVGHVLRGVAATSRGSAVVEGPHGELGARFADGLGGDDSHRLADLDRTTCGQHPSVAELTDAAIGLTTEHRTDLDPLDPGFLDLARQRLSDLDVHRADERSLERIVDVFGDNTTDHAVAQLLEDLATLGDGRDLNPIIGAAVVLDDNHVLRHIDQTTGEITRVGGLERGVGETFSRTVGRDEVLEHAQTLAEVRGDGRLHDLTRWLGHEAAHTGELTNLFFRSSSARIRHHEDGVVLARVEIDLRHLGEHLLGHVLGDLVPDVDDLVVPLTGGDETGRPLGLDLVNVFVGLDEMLFLSLRNHHVAARQRQPRQGGELEPGLLEVVEEDDGGVVPEPMGREGDEVLQPFLFELTIDEGHAVGQVRIEENPTRGGLHEHVLDFDLVRVQEVLRSALGDQIDELAGVAELDRRLGGDHPGLVSEKDLFGRGEGLAGALGHVVLGRQVVDPDNHVLGRDRQRPTGSRRKDVPRGHHEHMSFELRFL